MMEYALIAVAAVTALSTLGTTISGTFSKVNAKMAYEAVPPAASEHPIA